MDIVLSTLNWLRAPVWWRLVTTETESKDFTRTSRVVRLQMLLQELLNTHQKLSAQRYGCTDSGKHGLHLLTPRILHGECWFSRAITFLLSPS